MEDIKSLRSIVQSLTVFLLRKLLQNGWVSDYVEYKVYIDADISEYREYNREFSEHFAYFDYNFPPSMQMIGKDGYKHKASV